MKSFEKIITGGIILLLLIIAEIILTNGGIGAILR